MESERLRSVEIYAARWIRNPVAVEGRRELEVRGRRYQRRKRQHLEAVSRSKVLGQESVHLTHSRSRPQSTDARPAIRREKWKLHNRPGTHLRLITGSSAPSSPADTAT